MALAFDTSTPAYAQGTGTASTVTSATLTSVPAGAVFVLALNNNVNGIGVSAITDSLASHLTYTKQAGATITNGCASEIWTAPCPSAQASMTITATFGSSASGTGLMVGVWVFTGAASTQAGQSHTASSASGTPSVALASAAADSWIVAAIADGSNTTGPTIPAGQTDSFNGNTFRLVDTPNAANTWAQANSAAGNSNLTINDTAPTGIEFTAAAYEVQAAAGAAASIPDLIMAPAHR